MEVYLKKISYCVSFVIFFFVFSVFVSAEQFVINFDAYIASDSGGQRNNSDANPICVDTGDHICRKLAFCTDHDYWFYGPKSGASSNEDYYRVDTNFMTQKNCYYKDKAGNEYYNGKCSEIAGYVLAWAEVQFSYSEDSWRSKFHTEPNVSMFADNVSYGKKTTSGLSENYKIWYWKQNSLWAYFALADNKGDIILSNDKADNWYENNSMIREVIDNAMDEYARHSAYATKTLSTSNTNNVKKTVNFTITPSEGKSSLFYYYSSPGTKACDASGFYRTEDIVVTNNEADKDIDINISTNKQSSVQICISGVGCEPVHKKINLAPNGGTVSFYLKSNVDSNEDVTLSVVGSYSEPPEDPVNSIQYDTTRYLRGIEGSQGILTSQTYIKAPESDTISNNEIIHSSSQFRTFEKKKITRRMCNDIGDSSGNNNGFSSVNSQSINCESSPPSSIELTNSSYYVANFADCTCYSLPIEDDGETKYINLILYESAVFQYGRLVSEGDLYAGGGFYFDSIDTPHYDDEVIPTYYNAKVAWTYAEYIGVKPYFYNESNPSDYDASQYQAKIDEAIRKEIEKNLELGLTFEALDSNDYKNSIPAEYKLVMSLEITDVLNDYSQSSEDTQKKCPPTNILCNIDSNILNNGVSNLGFGTGYKNEFTIEGYLQMKEAYFSPKGLVAYPDKGEVMSDFSIFGGNKYYIPMYYKGDTFDFDILKSNVSVVDGIDFDLVAKCTVPVTGGDSFADIYYRSIDLENPFPRVNSDKSNVPANWKEWLYGDDATINDRRLRRTYQDYPNYPLYSITVNADILEDMKKNYIHNYTDWYGMDSDSSSSFVGKYFDYKGNMSYCPLGQFSSECDN